MMMTTRSKLRIRGGPYDGCGLSLVGGVTAMGREATNDIVVEQPVVSRKHAMIFYRDQGFWIQDLGSQNGTFVDGLRVGHQPRVLKNGERIQLGSSESGTVWEYSEAHEADLGQQSPATLQIPIGPTASAPAPTAPPLPGLPPQSGLPAKPGAPAEPDAAAQPRDPVRPGYPEGAAPQPQDEWSPCRAFTKNENGSWTCKYFVAFDTAGQQIEVSRGTTFVEGPGFLGFDMTEWLEENCTAQSYR